MILLKRISRTLDEAQPQEQVGLRLGFSCLDHIHTLSRAIEICQEYRLTLTCINYENAFDRVRTCQRSYGPIDGPNVGRHCFQSRKKKSQTMRAMSRLRDPAEYISEAKHSWAGHIM
ncbi:hypothetical protein RB195_022428 [Necator americanus]|uniref:Reverse transcriptase domain-containing protein n=1 Tax=Necator americanus TaxID=51031 RepID=A0ABR1EF89_NECAM